MKILKKSNIESKTPILPCISFLCHCFQTETLAMALTYLRVRNMNITSSITNKIAMSGAVGEIAMV